MSQPKFSRYIGIDYSGAKTPTTCLKALRVYVAEGKELPEEVSQGWSRKAIAKWLVEKLSEKTTTLVGIDHGFSFPLDYFARYKLKHDRPERDWSKFLEDFQHHWPTEEDFVSVESIRKGKAGKGQERSGNSKWLRLTEKHTREAGSGQPKSVFLFTVPGQVAYATHTGIPWLLHTRRELKRKRRAVHFWPFDGWSIPPNRSAIVEVYPALWNDQFTQECRNLNEHQRDAYSVAAWMVESDRNGRLDKFLKPELKPDEKEQAQIEGWILGVA